MDEVEKAKKILERVEGANNILILASRPVDHDCLGTALLTLWWVRDVLGKTSEAVIFSKIPERISNFPGVAGISEEYVNGVTFEDYDLIILVDGSSWEQYFPVGYGEIKQKVGLHKIVNIDHHEAGEIEKEIGKMCLRKKDCCTAKVVYDYFVKEHKDKITPEVATWIYLALIGDTQRFKHGMYEDTFDFASELLKLGADHDLAVDHSTDLLNMQFVAWAIQNTRFIPEIESSILIIDEQKNEELKETFGEKWNTLSLHKYYQEVVMRTVNGYNYGVMFQTDDRRPGIVGGWRTRNYGNRVSMQKVLKEMGFEEAGGHFGAGGGFSSTIQIRELEHLFINAMRRNLKKVNSN